MPAEVDEQKEHPEGFVCFSGAITENGGLQRIESAGRGIEPHGAKVGVDDVIYVPVAPITGDELSYERPAPRVRLNAWQPAQTCLVGGKSLGQAASELFVLLAHDVETARHETSHRPMSAIT
jgi:hypothetical protein